MSSRLTQRVQATPSKGLAGQRLLVPREHGAWAMWLAPFFVAVIAAGWTGAAPWVLLAAAFLLFWARYPLWVWARMPQRGFPRSALPTTALAGGAGAGLGAWLVAGWALPWLVPLALGGLLLLAIHLAFAARGLDRSLASEFLGICGLTMTGPAAAYAATGRLDSQAWAIWLLSALFFGVSVFYVKMKVDGYRLRKSHRGTAPVVLPLVVYGVVALVTVAALAAVGVVPWTALVAYAPVAAQAAVGVRRLDAPPRLKRLGLTWVGHSVAFGALAGLLLRLG